jgi:hypothetical protein
MYRAATEWTIAYATLKVDSRGSVFLGRLWVTLLIVFTIQHLKGGLHDADAAGAPLHRSGISCEPCTARVRASLGFSGLPLVMGIFRSTKGAFQADVFLGTHVVSNH